MIDWSGIASAVEKHVRPATFPVAVGFLSAGEEAPEKARRPLEDLGSPLALCQGITLTRTRGWTVAFGPSDSSCPVAGYTMGWAPREDTAKMTAFLQAMNYAADENVAERRVEDLARLTPGDVGQIVFSPLARSRVEPHLGLVYGNPAQVMRLVQAACRWSGGKVSGGFGGIAGSCNEGVLRTYLDQSPRVALPGNGDRVFAMTQDNEMVFAFPASWAERIAGGLEATAGSGIRYPIPFRFNHRLPFADLMARTEEDAGGRSESP